MPDLAAAVGGVAVGGEEQGDVVVGGGVCDGEDDLYTGIEADEFLSCEVWLDHEGEFVRGGFEGMIAEKSLAAAIAVCCSSTEFRRDAVAQFVQDKLHVGCWFAEGGIEDVCRESHEV